MTKCLELEVLETQVDHHALPVLMLLYLKGRLPLATSAACMQRSLGTALFPKELQPLTPIAMQLALYNDWILFILHKQWWLWPEKSHKCLSISNTEF